MHSAVPEVPVWCWTAMAVVVTTGLNLAGVKVAARAATAVVIAECVVLAMVLIGGITVLIDRGPARGVWTPLTGVGGFELSAVLGAVSVALRRIWVSTRSPPSPRRPSVPRGWSPAPC